MESIVKAWLMIATESPVILGAGYQFRRGRSSGDSFQNPSGFKLEKPLKTFLVQILLFVFSGLLLFESNVATAAPFLVSSAEEFQDALTAAATDSHAASSRPQFSGRSS